MARRFRISELEAGVPQMDTPNEASALPAATAIQIKERKTFEGYVNDGVRLLDEYVFVDDDFSDWELFFDYGFRKHAVSRVVKKGKVKVGGRSMDRSLSVVDFGKDFRGLKAKYHRYATGHVTLPVEKPDVNLSIIYLATKLSRKCCMRVDGLFERWLGLSKLPDDVQVQLIENVNFPLSVSTVNALRVCQPLLADYRFNSVLSFLLSLSHALGKGGGKLKLGFLFKWMWALPALPAGRVGWWLNVLASFMAGDSCNSCFRRILYGVKYDVPVEASYELSLIRLFLGRDDLRTCMITLDHGTKDFVKFRLRSVDEHSYEFITYDGRVDGEELGSYVYGMDVLRALHRVATTCEVESQYTPIVDLTIKNLLGIDGDGLALACYLVFRLDIVPLELTRYNGMDYRGFICSVRAGFGTSSARAHVRRLYVN